MAVHSDLTGVGDSCDNLDMSTTSEPQPVDEFLASRADWYAKDCPSDHPYAEQLRLSQSAPRPVFVAPLVTFR